MSCADSLRVAALCTEVRPNSHADVIVGRWLAPFPTDKAAGWQSPASQIISIYAEQRHPQRDLLPAWEERFGIQIASSVRDALTLGGDCLAVDAVLLIAEHGDYPDNEFGQKLYPRKEFFDAMIEVFDQCDQVLPVFFDKHLSWKPDWIHEMWASIERLGIPFFAGSSIPFSTPRPASAMHQGPRNSVGLFFGGLESYLFHTVELLESLDWGLRPGEVRLEVAEGLTAWDSLDTDPVGWELLVDAAQACGSSEILLDLRSERNSYVTLFLFEGEDGSRVRYFREPNRIRKWAAATRHLDKNTPLTAVANVRANPGFHSHFARLCAEVDQFFHTREVPFTPSRILTTSLITAWAMRARAPTNQSFTLPDKTEK